jgi:ABC-type amino acid transport substrate-binding protein
LIAVHSKRTIVAVALALFSIGFISVAGAQNKDVQQLETETVIGKKQKWDPKKTHPEVFDPVNNERWRAGFRESFTTEIPEDLKNVDALTRIRSMKRIVACADGWYFPFSRTAPKSEAPGIDIDILRDIAKRNEWKLDIVWANSGISLSYAFSATIDKGYCDFFVGLVHSDEDDDVREHKLVYTKPYVGVGFVLAVQGKAAKVKTLAEIKEKKIKVGVPMLSPMEEYVRANKMEYELYSQSNGLIDGMVKREVDAAMMWSGALAVAKNDFDVEFDVAPDFVPQPGQRWNGVWVVKEKETQLRAFLDEELQTMLKQGKIQSIVERYYMPFYEPFVN